MNEISYMQTDNLLMCVNYWCVNLDGLTLPPPQGFSFQQPRPKQRGGGVGLFISSTHKFKAISLPTRTSFESVSGKPECGQSCLIVFNVYHLPGPTTTVFSELQYILYYISTPHSLLMISYWWGRNFNLHIYSSSCDARQLTGILESFNLHQYVCFLV